MSRTVIMRTVVDLPDEQIEPLKALAQQMKLSRAELVRRAVADYLRRHRPAENDAAFGLWRDRGEDGVAYQERLRSKWDR
jgi:metal-responsive CopG/Arc/MetJ family transcriptional regulator